jgi:PAS domain S-box-containing protein
LKLFPDWKARIAFGFAVLALLLMGTVAYRSIVASENSDGWVLHTDEVLGTLNALLLSMESVQSSSRGFVLTGDDFFLTSYADSVSNARQEEASIRSLTVDNPRQQVRLPRLESLVAKRIEFARQAIALRRTAGFEAAADAVRSGQGQQVMTQFQAAVRTMKDEEMRLMVLREVDAKKRAAQTKYSLIFEMMLAVFLTAGAVWCVHRDSLARKLAEEMQRDGEDRFRNLATNISQLAWMANEKGSIFWYNERWYDYFGATAAEIARPGWAGTVHHPEHMQRVLEKFKRSIATGEVWEDTFPLRGADGVYRNFLSRAVPIRDGGGKVLRWFGTNTDISQIQQSEKDLAGSEDRYRGLLEAAPDAMVVVSQSGEIVLLNLQAEKHFGYRRDELIGQEVTSIIPEGFAERLIADGTRTAAEALAQQIGTGIELNGRRKDGSEFPIEIMLSPLDSAEGILVTAAIRDITVRKDAEKHLAQMEARYRGLLEAAPDGMVVVNQRGEIVLLNARAEKQFGYWRDELLGQKVKSIIPEGFAERLIADGTRTAAEALAQHIGTGIELYGLRKDGSEFPIEIMLSPLESAEGILVTAAIRDITTRKEVEAHLVQNVKELNRSNEELEQFAYVASHDLQEPLRMVASYTQLLSRRYKGKLDSDADDFIAFAVDGANRMQRLIQDLLTFSRVGKKGQDLVDVSSADTLRQAILNLRGAIEDSGAIVTHGPMPDVKANEIQLTQLFQNLVGNAIKYQGPGTPHIHISAVKNGSPKWIFSVQDDGLGIDPQFFERIFGMFQRLHKRDEFAGTGMGLAICKKIVERHGGSISVDSTPGKGSTFHFALAESERK